MTNIKSLFENVAKIWLQQLPLFVMLVIYTTVPTFFHGWYSYKTYLFILLPQVVLPSILLCLVASWRRWSWWIVFVFANLLWLIELGCYFCQHQRMWSWIAILIAQSDGSESMEYLSSVYVNLLRAIIVGIVSAVAFYIWDRFWQKTLRDKPWKKQTSRRRQILGLILTLSVVYSPVSIYKIAIKDKDYHSRINCFMQINSACTWIMYAYALNDAFNCPHINDLPHLVDTLASAEITLDNPDDSISVVYVIGESFSRNRSSLYGYPLDTNPMMAKELADSSLIIFNNVISFTHYTSIIYRTLLSTFDIQGDAPFENYPLLPSLMKDAGYKVLYIDNQKAITNGKADWTFSYFFSDDKVRKYCIDIYNEKEETYDADLIHKYYPSTSDSSDKNFIIYHLMGQHNDYKMRYPEDFTHFTKKDYSQFKDLNEKGAELMSEYDNATLYNDLVLNNIIEKLRDKTAVLIYSPDHGEEVYDYRDFSGRIKEAPVTSIRMYNEVPVMIWMSDSFRQKYPDIVSALRSNTHKAIYNSDLPQTILDIVGIRTATFNPDVSLLREGKGRTHRHVMMYDIDYDAMHDEIYSQKLRYEQ